ncbi:MAG: hypothetical protein M2R45_01844 [Verrucomicrobia subdivision 3 bacterium]|nr:hypothetical protein [Limisphaerales bacterium]MCS1415644.1 hypothetical protein [Limisphaerales bacterium]
MVETPVMMSDSISIPCSLSGAFGGFGTAEGLIHYEGKGLRLEIDSQFLGIFNTGVQEVKVLLDDLLSVEFKSGWFTQSLKFQGKSLRTFKGIPGCKQGKLELHVAKEDRAKAEHLATMLSAHLTTKQLNQIQDDLNSI